MSEDKWLLDAMQKINDLTPDIKGKAFDPDWFLLREHLEKPVAELAALRAALAERQAAIDELVATDDARKDLEARYMSFTSYGGFQVASDGVKRRQRAAIDTARALATKEPQP